jgi:integrase
MSNVPRRRRPFGSIRQLKSGRYQARYKGPDGITHTADMTFPTKAAADAFLATVQADLIREQWKAPVRSQVTVATYAENWLRQHPRLKATTRATYESDYRLHIKPYLGHLQVRDLTAEIVREWRATIGAAVLEKWQGRGSGGAGRRRTGQATQARVYRLLRAILNTAVEDGHREGNPCSIKNGGEYDAAERPTLSSVEIELLAATIDEHYRCYVYVAAYLGLRAGEMAGLRRRHVDLDQGTVEILQTEGRYTTPDAPAPPKSEAGRRKLALPQFLTDMLREHLREQATIDPDAYVFVTRRGRNVYYGASRALRKALTDIGRIDVVGHDLRHTASGLKARNGATMADLKRELGHSTVDAAQRYMHANVDNQRRTAERLDAHRREVAGSA